jgi:hypothetical protein
MTYVARSRMHITSPSNSTSLATDARGLFRELTRALCQRGSWVAPTVGGEKALQSSNPHSVDCRCRLRREVSRFPSCATHTDNRPKEGYLIIASTPADCPCHPRRTERSAVQALRRERRSSPPPLFGEGLGEGLNHQATQHHLVVQTLPPVSLELGLPEREGDFGRGCAALLQLPAVRMTASSNCIWPIASGWTTRREFPSTPSR